MSDSIVTKFETGVDPEAHVAPLGHVRVFTSERGTGKKWKEDYPISSGKSTCPEQAKVFARTFITRNPKSSSVQAYDSNGDTVFSVFKPKS